MFSGTVHPNPEWVSPNAYEQNIISVCHWNLNGLLANNFVKITLLEAFLATYKYDIVILSENFITSKIKTDENGLKINGYTMKRCDHPSDDPRGAICVYHKESLPLKLVPDMTSLSETFVMEVKIGRNKCFITALYRSPSVENNTADEMNCFISNILWRTLTSKILMYL